SISARDFSIGLRKGEQHGRLPIFASFRSLRVHHCSVPLFAHAAQERWINDQSAERCDCRHVKGRQTADVAYINREVKTVASLLFNQRAQRGGVDRPVGQFHEFFVLELIDDEEMPFANSRRRKRLGLVSLCEPVTKRRAGLCRRSRTVPAEDASNKKAQIQQPTYDRRRAE